MLKQSIIMQERGKKRIPGLSMLLSKRPDMFTNGVWPGYFESASGAMIRDLDGNEYLDMSIAGIGANVLGYADPEVDEAVKAVIAKGVSSSLLGPEEVELAEVLCELHPWAEMCQFTRAGGEAMALAVRVARTHTGRDTIAFCGYHGWHDWYLSANLGESSALDGHLLPGLAPAGVPRALAGTAKPFRYNRLDELETIVQTDGAELAAIVMEPLRNEEPMPDFLAGVRALADETGAVLVVDEISAGFRLCTGGAHLVQNGPQPDIAVFSKALGNGYPIAAVIGRRDVMDSAQRSFISSTNWTERTGPAAALATIAKHQRENVAEHLILLGERVQNGWAALAEKYGLEIHVGGMKPMSHFAFVVQPLVLKAYFIQLMLERGILASTLYYAMHAHTNEDVERYLAAVDECFGIIARELEHGDVAGKLRGCPATEGFKRLA